MQTNRVKTDYQRVCYDSFLFEALSIWWGMKISVSICVMMKSKDNPALSAGLLYLIIWLTNKKRESKFFNM